MTLPPRPGKRNERFRDLIDLLLMETMVATDFGALRDACELVFSSRGTHEWPPNLEMVPAHWGEPFAQLAEELQLVEKDIATALARVRALVERILSGY